MRTPCPQIGQLRRLRVLQLCHPPRQPAGWGVLARLRSVRRLELEAGVGCLPACLPRLTWLRSLSVLDTDFEDMGAAADAVARTLPRLRGLTSLVRRRGRAPRRGAVLDAAAAV